MLARRLTTIVPAMRLADAQETTRPFRALFLGAEAPDVFLMILHHLLDGGAAERCAVRLGAAVRRLLMLAVERGQCRAPGLD